MDWQTKNEKRECEITIGRFRIEIKGVKGSDGCYANVAVMLLPRNDDAYQGKQPEFICNHLVRWTIRDFNTWDALREIAAGLATDFIRSLQPPEEQS
jgi:hypothetical protein